LKTICCFFLSFFILLLVACTSPEPPPDPVTINFRYVGYDNRASEREYYQNLADQFNEEFPHITVEVGFSSLFSAFYGGELGSDSMVVPDFIFGALVDEELIRPLEGYFETDTDFPYDDFYAGMLDIYTIDSQTWAIPAGVDPYVFYYNKNLFDQAGVYYPEIDWTWDDFLAAAVAVSDPGYGIFGYGPTLVFGPDSNYLESIVFVYQHGGKIFDDFKSPSEFVFTDPKTIEALDWYGALYNNHMVAPTQERALEAFGGPATASIYQGIGNEQIAIWGGVLSERGGQSYIPVPWEFAYGILPPPQGQEDFNLVFSTAYVMAAETEYPEETWLWLKFLTQQLGYGDIPVRKSIVEGEAFADIYGEEMIAVIKVILEDARYLPNTFEGDLNRDIDSFRRALIRIVEQGETAAEAMNWAENR
jgi:multiple sugar transport system substrate-binding protein